MRLKAFTYLAVGLMVLGVACKNKTKHSGEGQRTQASSSRAQFKGLYSLGPDIRSFKDCATGREYWVADSTRQLELKYWQLVTAENHDQPVYIEVDGDIKPSNFSDADEAYPNTLIVRKLITITKDIPAGKCN
jgi:copper homeostasis protein (lipoprotein)